MQGGGVVETVTSENINGSSRAGGSSIPLPEMQRQQWYVPPPLAKEILAERKGEKCNVVEDFDLV